LLKDASGRKDATEIPNDLDNSNKGVKIYYEVGGTDEVGGTVYDATYLPKVTQKKGNELREALADKAIKRNSGLQGKKPGDLKVVGYETYNADVKELTHEQVKNFANHQGELKDLPDAVLKTE